MNTREADVKVLVRSYVGCAGAGQKLAVDGTPPLRTGLIKSSSVEISPVSTRVGTSKWISEMGEEEKSGF